MEEEKKIIPQQREKEGEGRGEKGFSQSVHTLEEGE